MKYDIFFVGKEVAHVCYELIFHRNGTLKMRVFRLTEMNFKPRAEELQRYANDHGDLLAFETYDYNKEDPGLIIEASRWYANYVEYPEILPENPPSEINNQ
jgi:hypothetical protein